MSATPTPSGYRIRAPFTVQGAYTLDLTKAAAKAICADWLDPDEPWADQAEHTLETALESVIEDLFNEHLLSFPAVINSKIEGRAIALKLDESCLSLDVDYLEVSA